MRVVVIGAGIAGLAAARALQPRHDVTVIERARSVGGRMATRRIGDATLDHGAQFFTVRTASFGRQVDAWHDAGLVRVWCHGFGERPDGYPRYIGTNGMNALAKDLAHDVDVRLGALAFAIRPSATTAHGWDVVLDDARARAADAVVLTCPVPQSWALLATTETDLPESLFRTDYQRTIALLAVLDQPSSVPVPGAVQFDGDHPDSPFGFIADQHTKGVSAVPAVTFHAPNRWSAEHWDQPHRRLRDLLVDRARPWLGEAQIVEAQIKKWRFATPSPTWPDPCWVGHGGRIVMAGDAFAGPRIEGAYESGLAAAAAVDSLS